MAEENSSGARARTKRRPRGSRRRNKNTTKDLPEEVLDEILSRVPVKSLIRFESVCKSWRSKFHSRPFIDLYTRRSRIRSRRPNTNTTNNDSLAIHSILTKKLLETAPGLKLRWRPSADEVDPWMWRPATRVFGPLSNGIYCLACHLHLVSRNRFRIWPGKIALCNPSIGDYKFAKPFPRWLHSRVGSISSEPCRLHFGFGQVGRGGDYRVVVIVHLGDSVSSVYLNFVYSLQSGEWKEIELCSAFYRARIAWIGYPIEACPQRFLQGCWHWAARGEDHSYSVLSYSFADEAFELIGAPLRNNNTPHLYGSVLVLHDRLAFMSMFDPLLPHHDEADVRIWMMMEYGVEESWTRVYRINPNFLGRFIRLVAIDYTTTPQEGDKESGGIRIERLVFKDNFHQTIACDDVGSRVLGLKLNLHEKTVWNSPGISSYLETLERL